MKPITNKDDKRLVLKQLSDIQRRADKGVHLHSDYAQLAKILIRVVKTLQIEEE